MKHPRAADQTFLISDGKDISLENLIKFILEGMGKSRYIFSVPSFIVNFFSKFLNQNSKIDKLISSMRIDISRNQEVLGWKPPINLEEGLSRTVRWYIKNK
jgi:nucleoside-diphosphate-sugar epimerase